MLYTTATIAGKEYKLRLGAQDCIDVERRLGKSALDVFLQMAPKGASPDASPDELDLKTIAMPHVEDLCIILCGAMQRFQHGMTLPEMLKLYDAHIESGGGYNDFIPIVRDVLEVSGYIPKEEKKNESAAEDAAENPPVDGQPAA